MINLIVAIGINNLIGIDNDLPWYYPEDLQYFKKMTLHKTVLMGEKTFNSILDRLHKPLPHRKSIVATLDKSFRYDGVEIVYDLLQFLKETEEDIFIIGGKQIYSLSLPFVERLYITHIKKEYPGNVFFPEIDYQQFKKISQEDSGDLSFCVYERITK